MSIPKQTVVPTVTQYRHRDTKPYRPGAPTWADPRQKPLFRAVLIVTIIVFVLDLAIFASLLFPQVFKKDNTEQKTYVVSGQSMEPTLKDKDRITLTKNHDTPEKNDIIVGETPDSWAQGRTKPTLIKRVAATTGDTITVESGKLKVNGKEYATTKGIDCRISSYSKKIPKGYVFVVGDNPPHSTDSLSVLCQHPTHETYLFPEENIKDYGSVQKL
jgi:signal peptidase I